MKQYLTIMLLALLPKSAFSQSAKALYCSDQNTLVFVYDKSTYATNQSITVDGKNYKVTGSYAINNATPGYVPKASSTTTAVQDQREHPGLHAR